MTKQHLRLCFRIMSLPFIRTDTKGTVKVKQMWVKWPLSGTSIRQKTVLAQTTQTIWSCQKDIKRIEHLDDVHLASKENI